MSTVVKGILTRGLGGDATSMILGKFNLGKASITIEIEPPVIWDTGGGETPAQEPVRSVIITVRYGDMTWKKRYVILASRITILVSINRIINTISTNIKMKVNSIRKLLNKIRIKKYE